MICFNITYNKKHVLPLFVWFSFQHTKATVTWFTFAALSFNTVVLWGLFDCSQDWNTFLLRFNELDFCISENETLKHSLNESTTPESTVTSGQARPSTQAPSLLEDPGPINISVPITLTLDPLRPFGGYSRNITHLYATILGQQLGLAGIEGSASCRMRMLALANIALAIEHELSTTSDLMCSHEMGKLV